MESFVKKLSYFNLSACLIYLALAKVHDDWLSFILLLFPLFFNWKVLQDLKTGQFNLGFWNYLTAIVTLIYIALSIFVIIEKLLFPLAQEKAMFILLGLETIFSLALLFHFSLCLKMYYQNKLNKN